MGRRSRNSSWILCSATWRGWRSMSNRRRISVITAVVFSASVLGQVQTPKEPEWDVQKARGKTRQITFDTDEGTWMSLSVTPDGKTIVFDLLGEIYSMPATGGTATSMTANSGVALNLQPAVSPD